MSGVRVYAGFCSHWVAFWVQNSLNEGPIFGKFSLKMGGFSRIWEKLSKMDSFTQKFIIKVGLTATFLNQKRVAF